MLKTQRQECYQPRECDVICGRGKTFAGHPGNKIFLRLVRSSLEDYVNATGRFDRTLIVSHIAANFREYGVRFARVGGEKPGVGSNKKRSLAELIEAFQFYEINDERKIHEKIGHAFRDMIRAQNTRSMTPAESNDGSSPSSDADSVPSEPSVPISKVTKLKGKKKPEKAQPKQKRPAGSRVTKSKKTQEEADFPGKMKAQMSLPKGYGYQENLALAFFEVESHVHQIHDEKPDEEISGEDKDPFVPDVSVLFNDSDSLAGLSFNSHEEPEDCQQDSSLTMQGDSTNNIPARILVHWSKESQCNDKIEMLDKSLKNMDSKYDADAARWTASNGSIGIDPRRLLREPLINDWNINSVEFCADFNPTNFDMSLSLVGSSHNGTTENKQQDVKHAKDDTTGSKYELDV